jgi:putative ABC transport system ATP-binding protein
LQTGVAASVIEPIVAIEGLEKSFLLGEVVTPVLRGVSLRVPRGAFVAITGPSGCGKTTLLSLIGGLDRPDRGRLVVEGTDVAALDERGRQRYRAERVGFIFQFYNLLPTLTALENVEIGLELRRLPARERQERARRYLARVGLADRADHYPAQLSGGEQQRVAVARAAAREPALLLADEPTGNLDRASGEQVVELLRGLQRELGTTCVMVTHDLEQARKADEVVGLLDGRVAR